MMKGTVKYPFYSRERKITGLKNNRKKKKAVKRDREIQARRDARTAHKKRKYQVDPDYGNVHQSKND